MNENNHLELKTALRRNLIRATLVPLQSGCLAFAMATLAILAGIWLDFRLETFPRWTLILLVGSAPIALVIVYFVVRRTLRGLQAETNASEPEDEV
ncbi:MAG TPA: AtpZ/AtpI family protein [Brevefilum fermentans]|jgi:hypothetical protein|nr:AtpZ/AtpI family protein [Brevefilum fermentans]HQA29054.1 AtpZ/AtpI family protein [Brevefilum fermentans]